MNSPIIYQNPECTVVLLDLPRSLEDGQALNCAILSTAGIEQPWPSTEPKGTKREHALASIDPDVLSREQELQTEICAALDELTTAVFTAQLPWLYLRSVTGSAGGFPDHVLPYSDCPGPMTVPPLILSNIPGPDQFISTRQVQDVVVLNPSSGKHEITVKGERYLIPGSSRFLWSSILTGLRAMQDAASILMQSKFDLILMDPPWANRSVRRSQQYRTTEAQYSDPFIHTLAIVDRHLSADGVVAIWTANKPADRVRIEANMQKRGLHLREEWIWTKITSRGVPVTALDGLWRKPYETVLLFSRNDSTANLRRRFIFAVTDLHSRKPCLKQLFVQILPPGYQALELFARSLTAGWWSWGDEVLKFQHHSCWVHTTVKDRECNNSGP